MRIYAAAEPSAREPRRRSPTGLAGTTNLASDRRRRQQLGRPPRDLLPRPGDRPPPGGHPVLQSGGLSAIPRGKLLFGIPEKGADFESADCVIEIVSVSDRMVDGVLRLTDDFAVAYCYGASKQSELRHPVALSDFAYNPEGEAPFLLTSFEGPHAPGELGGFLRELPLSDLLAGQPPQLVRRREERAAGPLRQARGGGAWAAGGSSSCTTTTRSWGARVGDVRDAALPAASSRGLRGPGSRSRGARPST